MEERSYDDHLVLVLTYSSKREQSHGKKKVELDSILDWQQQGQSETEEKGTAQLLVRRRRASADGDAASSREDGDKARCHSAEGTK